MTAKEYKNEREKEIQRIRKRLDDKGLMIFENGEPIKTLYPNMTNAERERHKATFKPPFMV